MRIYLRDKLLIASEVFPDASEVFPDAFEERKKRDALREMRERDWGVYTWNSRGKLRAEEDGTSSLNDNTVEVELLELGDGLKASSDEFVRLGLGMPNHYIGISAYNSFIRTPVVDVIKLCDRMEREEIESFVYTCAAPVTRHWVCASPRIRRALPESYCETFALAGTPLIVRVGDSVRNFLKAVREAS